MAMFQSPTLRTLKRFFSDECGATTSEWVLASAMIVASSVAVLSTVSVGVMDLSYDVSANISGSANLDALEGGPDAKFITVPTEG